MEREAQQLDKESKIIKSRRIKFRNESNIPSGLKAYYKQQDDNQGKIQNEDIQFQIPQLTSKGKDLIYESLPQQLKQTLKREKTFERIQRLHVLSENDLKNFTTQLSLDDYNLQNQRSIKTPDWQIQN